ncbi:hypothetical protein [Lutimonas zeaxanthinifaciens]|uniref:hypothetical protein n=1 Tax=Lutimonas zeaxanthinifaciens TaxID=3060215 RepID=UPI00265CF254|nr:hypothetical protein [Lutimonas sp. YSD2104]WKK67131.1 hypothetical protein QZH61_05785 [Lutimonas sp. YSD2104]
MKKFKFLMQTKPFNKLIILFLPGILMIQSCKKDQKTTEPEMVESEKDYVVEIITENMDFQMSDTISSGWNTFRYKNLSPQTHFFLIDKYPEGKTSEDAEKVVGPVFDSAMKLIMEGKTEEGYAEFEKLPEWFGEVVFVGGSGLLSPNQVGETTLNLKPGKYIVECYVKMSNGVFHTSMGMTKDIEVTTNDSGNKELSADIDVNVSSTEGIVFNDSISPGEHTFSVFFKDQIVHENFVGHDINLVRIDGNSDLKVLENWMNWADPKGLIEPAPQGFTFMGGVNDMPQGNKGYFTASLEPGTYALISEVPNASTKNMLKTFIVLND